MCWPKRLPKERSEKVAGVHSVRSCPRAGWDAAFKRMHEVGDDRLLIDDHLGLDFAGWEC